MDDNQLRVIYSAWNSAPLLSLLLLQSISRMATGGQSDRVSGQRDRFVPTFFAVFFSLQTPVPRVVPSSGWRSVLIFVLWRLFSRTSSFLHSLRPVVTMALWPCPREPYLFGIYICTFKWQPLKELLATGNPEFSPNEWHWRAQFMKRYSSLILKFYWKIYPALGGGGEGGGGFKWLSRTLGWKMKNNFFCGVKSCGKGTGFCGKSLDKNGEKRWSWSLGDSLD